MGLRFAPAVQDFVRTLAPGPTKEIREALRLLALDQRHPGLDVKVLHTEGPLAFFRARVKGYRIIYTTRSSHVYVWRIQHRSDGYDWIERLDP